MRVERRADQRGVVDLLGHRQTPVDVVAGTVRPRSSTAPLGGLAKPEGPEAQRDPEGGDLARGPASGTHDSTELDELVDLLFAGPLSDRGREAADHHQVPAEALQEKVGWQAVLLSELPGPRVRAWTDTSPEPRTSTEALVQERLVRPAGELDGRPQVAARLREPPRAPQATSAARRSHRTALAGCGVSLASRHGQVAASRKWKATSSASSSSAIDGAALEPAPAAACRRARSVA